MPVPITVDHRATASGEGLAAVGVRAGRLAADAPGVDEEVAALARFEAKPGQTMVAGTDAGPVLLVGLGEAPDPAAYRRAGAAAARAASRRPVVEVDALSGLEGGERVAAAEALAEGLALGAYAFADYKDPEPEVALDAAVVVAKGGRPVADAVARGALVGAAIGLARDLVNTPGGHLTPAVFAEEAVDLAREHGLEVEVLDRAAVVEAGMGGLAGVNRGSAQEARFVTLAHRPGGRVAGRVALVGKGVTFDAGGLSIKTATGMDGMKGDMAGAAAVLAAMTLVPTLAPRLEVTAYLPLTDNMLGPDAMRVGDVLRLRNDKTVEVLNTDAEGRLLLADALALAAESSPDAIVDLATLTGACMVALGDRTAGLMGNDDDLLGRLRRAADEAGEPLWPLPMPDHLRATLDSPIADLRNIGTGNYGGALTAALFLREFVGECPWAHLDIAGPAYTQSGYDEVPKGGTGFGVRTLARLLAGWGRRARS